MNADGPRLQRRLPLTKGARPHHDMSCCPILGFEFSDGRVRLSTRLLRGRPQVVPR